MSADCSEPEESQHHAPRSCSALMTASGNGPTDSPRATARDAGECYHCPMWHSGHIAMPGNSRHSKDDDTGRYGSKERERFLERTQRRKKSTGFPGENLPFCRSSRHVQNSRLTDQETTQSSACTAGGQWHQWQQNPQQWKACETLLVPVPLLSQTPMTELDCKTGRNKSINTAIFFCTCKTQAVRKPKHSSTQLLGMLSGKEEQLRHWKLFWNTQNCTQDNNWFHWFLQNKRNRR